VKDDGAAWTFPSSTADGAPVQTCDRHPAVVMVSGILGETILDANWRKEK